MRLDLAPGPSGTLVMAESLNEYGPSADQDSHLHHWVKWLESPLSQPGKHGNMARTQRKGLAAFCLLLGSSLRTAACTQGSGTLLMSLFTIWALDSGKAVMFLINLVHSPANAGILTPHGRCSSAHSCVTTHTYHSTGRVAKDSFSDCSSDHPFLLTLINLLWKWELKRLTSAVQHFYIHSISWWKACTKSLLANMKLHEAISYRSNKSCPGPGHSHQGPEFSKWLNPFSPSTRSMS